MRPSASMHSFSTRIFFIFITILFCLPLTSQAADHKKILLLNSYSYDMPWTRAISNAVLESFEDEEEVEIIVEFMDTKRHSQPEYYKSLLAGYVHKYSNVKFDVIITSDDNGSKFALENRSILFPDTPIVFCGVNDVYFINRADFTNITGALEVPGFEETLNTAVELLPDTKNVFIINESRTTGEGDRRLIEEALQSLSNSITAVWWEDKSEKEIQKLLNTMPEESFILFLSFFGNKGEREFTLTEGVKYISEQSTVPVFSMWDYLLGEGIIGGLLTSGRYQGVSAANLAKQVLSGTQADNIPVISTTANRYMFDYLQLLRANIPEKVLPKGAIVINKPTGLFDKYKETMIGVSMTMVLMLILIIVLLTVNRSRRLVANKLRRSEARLALAQRVGKIGSWEYTPKSGNVWLSEEMYHIFSLKTDEEISLESFRSLIHIEDRNSLFEFIQQQDLAKTVEFEKEFRIKGIDDSSKHVLVSGGTQYNETGEPKFTGVAFDVTDKKETERDLLNERERLAVTLRSIGDGVITTDIDGRIVFLNKVAEELTGWSNEEAKGRPSPEIFNIINEKTGVKCASPVQRVLKLGRIIGLANHTAIVTKDGSLRSIADSGAPIRDRKSNIIGVIIVFRDVTKEKRLEDELLKARKLESVGVLAGGIAHDFNNILSAILGNIELASRQLTEEDNRVATLLTNAQKATLRASKLTNQLLTFSKGGDPIKEATSLPKLVEESANFVLHGSHVSCDFEFPENLWTVEADSGQFSQVIQNIVINARHAMPEGGKIFIRCNNVTDPTSEAFLSIHEDDFVCITIQDFGIGIPREILDKIFDPYFTTKQEGSGLGLAICHSIVSKHDGHILVKSTPGKGTTFTIYMPATSESSRSDNQPHSAIKTARAANIMVMDDEEMLRELAHSQLTNLGHRVILVEDGDQALNKFQELQDKQTPVDLFIMDLTIRGGMGGKETCSKLLQIAPEARIIVSSGYSNDPIIANYKEYGFCAAVTKPFNLPQLSDAIDIALKS